MRRSTATEERGGTRNLAQEKRRPEGSEWNQGGAREEIRKERARKAIRMLNESGERKGSKQDPARHNELQSSAGGSFEGVDATDSSSDSFFGRYFGSQCGGGAGSIGGEEQKEKVRRRRKTPQATTDERKRDSKPLCSRAVA